ncbi:MAG: hypothetical protein EFT35_04855 [Methanophagales archaeon ANME-1-THS]|nr:MAG: hypothetical protein EFT35_04855 [Methanophagales archaeon ANME-1-THS]
MLLTRKGKPVGIVTGALHDVMRDQKASEVNAKEIFLASCSNRYTEER